MPELPEAEAMRRRIAPAIEGRRIASLWSGQRDRGGWTARDRRDLVGARIEGVGRHGKLVFLEIEGGRSIAFRLGMSGRLVLRAVGDVHDRAAVELSDGTTLVFSDFRRFGGWRVLHGESPAEAFGLGPDALSPGFVPATLVSTSRRSVKSALLDQRLVAGIGNIYACESLFAARMHPERELRSLGARERGALVRSIRRILRASIRHGGATLEDYRATEGEAGSYERRFAVFGREGDKCPGCECDGAVLRVVEGGRSTFFCPVRQRQAVLCRKSL
jgi:formamidopyrimidine-DNA glycosylase